MKEELYKNCSELPIFNFFEVTKTHDLSWLLRDRTKIDLFTEEELSNHLIQLIKEYNELIDNKDLLREYKDTLDIELLEYRYNVTKMILNLYVESKAIEVLLALRELQWTIDTSKEINHQVKRITKVLVGIKNQIKIKKSKFLKKFNKIQKEETPNFDLRKSIINLEVNVPLNFRVDVHKDSINDYVIWNNILEEKIKATKNG